MIRWCSVSCLHSTLENTSSQINPMWESKRHYSETFVSEGNKPSQEKKTYWHKEPTNGMVLPHHPILWRLVRSPACTQRTSYLLHNIYFKFYFLYSYMCNNLKSQVVLHSCFEKVIFQHSNSSTTIIPQT